jgi:hypothetical protein
MGVFANCDVGDDGDSPLFGSPTLAAREFLRRATRIYLTRRMMTRRSSRATKLPWTRLMTERRAATRLVADRLAAITMERAGGRRSQAVTTPARLGERHFQPCGRAGGMTMPASARPMEAAALSLIVTGGSLTARTSRSRRGRSMTSCSRGGTIRGSARAWMRVMGGGKGPRATRRKWAGRRTRPRLSPAGCAGVCDGPHVCRSYILSRG